MRIRITRIVKLYRDLDIPDELYEQMQIDETGDVYNEDVAEAHWPAEQIKSCCDDFEIEDEYYDPLKGETP